MQSDPPNLARSHPRTGSGESVFGGQGAQDPLQKEGLARSSTSGEEHVPSGHHCAHHALLLGSQETRDYWAGHCYRSLENGYRKRIRLNNEALY